MTTLQARALDDASFAPFGAVIEPADDGEVHTPGDPPLDLSGGMPRFYVMRLQDKAPRFDRITRHRSVTQCLASVGGAEWLLAVAPPEHPDDPEATPDVARLAAFIVPGDVAVLLHRGTWHAGPFFTAPSQSFFNLELTDTNVVDHHTVALGDWFEITA